MKKTIKIEQGQHPEMAQRRVEGIAKAIARRLNIETTSEVKTDKGIVSVDIDLTASQIKKLPIGLQRYVE